MKYNPANVDWKAYKATIVAKFCDADTINHTLDMYAVKRNNDEYAYDLGMFCTLPIVQLQMWKNNFTTLRKRKIQIVVGYLLVFFDKWR